LARKTRFFAERTRSSSLLHFFRRQRPRSRRPLTRCPFGDDIPLSVNLFSAYPEMPMPASTIARKLDSLRKLTHIERFYTLETDPHEVRTGIPITFTLLSAWSPGVQAKLDLVKGAHGDWQSRFARGHYCFLAEHDGHPTCFGWASAGEWGGAGPAKPLARDSFFGYDVLTNPDFRGHSIAPAGMAYRASEMCKLGFPRSCTTIRDRNVASQNGARKVGYVRTPYTVRVFRMKWLYGLQSGGPPPNFLP
jgi:hypothetical protein